MIYQSRSRRWAPIAAINASSCPETSVTCTLQSISIYKFLRTMLLRQSTPAWMWCYKDGIKSDISINNASLPTNHMHAAS